MALEALTAAELETLKTALLASYQRSLNATGYQIGTRQLSRAGPGELLKQLAEVSAEIARRSDLSGGVGVIEFGEPL